jgi:hypothetical protein
MSLPAQPPASEPAWRRWSLTLAGAALVFAAVLAGFVVVLDPFGLRVSAGRPARPLMDLNQRYMYPQLVRSGAFDAAVFGTSTMRLIDPAALSQVLGARFVNLAMNAATPWEQTQMAELFARMVAAPATAIWGIDRTWCEADATTPRKRLTPRPFPPWLYDGANWLDLGRQLNLTTLEIAARLLSHRLGFQRARIRGDGYEVFTPPEATYDPGRARLHLYPETGGVAPDQSALVPPEPASADEREGWRFPALDWLDQALSRFPATTRKLVVLPPTHIASLPRPGSAEARHYDACKAALAAVAARRGASLVDYAHSSDVTRRDDNYWDRLHFRLPVARRVEADLALAASGWPLPADGVATVTGPTR